MSKIYCSKCAHSDCWIEVSTNVTEEDYYEWDEEKQGYSLKQQDHEVYGDIFFRCDYCSAEADENLKERIINAIKN